MLIAILFFLKMGQSRPLFVYFRYFLFTISTKIEKSVDGVLGIRTWGADETTVLWRPLAILFFFDNGQWDRFKKAESNIE